MQDIFDVEIKSKEKIHKYELERQRTNFED